MSTWGIGDNHDSAEVFALKEQLRTKDAAHATLHGEYLKRETELNDVKASLNDLLDKLRREADRVIQLDADLKRRNEELAKERITRQNAEVALTAAHRKLKDSEEVALELQSTIDTISLQATSTSAGRSKLEQDNAALQTRVRSLERELQSKTRAEELALRQSQSSSASARNRRRSSSDSSFRLPALEKEVSELRALSSQQTLDLEKATEQLARSRDSVVQLQNEKTASEKRLVRELHGLQAKLDDREQDLHLLRDANGGEDVAAREADLLQRLEDEEKRIVALENELARSTGSRKRDLALLQDELDRTLTLLDDAKEKVSVAEERLAELAREKVQALDERDRLEQERARLSRHLDVAGSRISELEAHLSDSTQPAAMNKSPDEATVATMEKLLNTIERLRGERDGLRRDLEFLNAENRFAVQSLEAKLTVATSTPVTPAVDAAELNILRGHVRAFQEQAERSGRATVALAIVAQHAGNLAEESDRRTRELVQQLTVVHEDLQGAGHHVQQRDLAVDELKHKLASTTSSLDVAEQQVFGLRSTIQRLENELSNERNSHAETGAALADAESQLTSVNLALTDAEAARDALALEKMHLQQDLDTARQELADADSRHAQQLDALASGQPGKGAQVALRQHIKELEERIERRTAQIGMHQHDIARLEMNLKLQEERIAEMTVEMDTAQGEKDAMLEDCRATREQRDEALRKCDELEEALEAVEEARGVEVEGVVGVAFGALAARRDALVRSMHAGTSSQEELSRLEVRIQAVEGEKEVLSARVASAVSESERLALALDESARAFENLKHEHGQVVEEGQRMSSALSLAQAQMNETLARVRAAEDAKATVELQLATTRDDLESKFKELIKLQDQLAALRDTHADRQSLEASLFAQEKTELESQLTEAKETLAALEAHDQDTVAELRHVEEELKRAEDELAHHLSASAIRSESEERLRDELVLTKEQHQAEVVALQEELKSVSEELVETMRLRTETDALRQAAEEELGQTKQQLETRLAEASESLNAVRRLEEELELLKATHREEMKTLRERFDSASAELEDVTARRDELQALHERLGRESEERVQQLAETCDKAEALELELIALRGSHAGELQALEKHLADTTEELCELRDSKADTDAQQREKIDELSRTAEELQGRVTALTKEADECRAELAEERATHTRMQETTMAELREAISKRNKAEAALAQVEHELPAVRTQLEHVEASLAQADEEKLNLEYQVTNLEAEVQRVKSLQRFLESQNAEGERRVSELGAELEILRAKCTTLDKLAQTTEANLAMQTIQHEQTVASLKRELNALRSQPRFEDEIAELKEKNAEYEELLRAKCLEIEENDDRFIEMLKEKKKRNSKIDSLSRKVQNLQTKLTAATEAASKVSQSPAPIAVPVAAPIPRSASTFSPTGLAPAPVLSTSLASSSSRAPLASSSSSRPLSRPRVVTAPAVPSPNPAHHRPPPMPTFRPKTPESRSRMMSGPSSLSRPKTPDSRVPPMPVFKARTPERQRAPTAPSSYTMPESSSSSSVVGVKRRAPDDFDDCGSLPPQPFTADSAPGTHLPAQPTTPRLRKALQSMRTGFTPIRHNMGRAGSTSPSRRATTGSSTASIPPTISDVTNSPRASSHSEGMKAAAKKGWLGKLKSGPSQARAPLASRPPVFDPPGMR
ncbi:hypothetical protein C8Q78DRAFT_1018750 [Trametes maxima]|nr:hypothetical protein C8Q78DRAFT_1018750 [Trametes maxima]